MTVLSAALLGSAAPAAAETSHPPYVSSLAAADPIGRMIWRERPTDGLPEAERIAIRPAPNATSRHAGPVRVEEWLSRWGEVDTTRRHSE